MKVFVSNSEIQDLALSDDPVWFEQNFIKLLGDKGLVLGGVVKKYLEGEVISWKADDCTGYFYQQSIKETK